MGNVIETVRSVWTYLTDTDPGISNVQTGGDNVNVTAQSGGMVNAPTVSGCTNIGSVSFGIAGAPVPQQGGASGQQSSPGQAEGAGGINMNVTAHSGGMVNAPTISGSTISGPVNFGFAGGAPK